MATFGEIMKKKALITGVTGQDGSYLAELLVSKGYQVVGMVRRSSSVSISRIQSLVNKRQLQLEEGDLSDATSLRRILEMTQPDEIYNLAAMSHVQSSFLAPEYTVDIDGVGVLRLLQAVKEVVPCAKVYQASTSELFGKVRESPQNEKTPFYPRSPYGIAKLYAFWTVVNYREAYELFACNGILFNHESPRRGEGFVSRKISLGVCRIALGLSSKLSLGNLDAYRDWGYAKDFVEGMWLMLQQENPQDFVLATGKTHTVREFVEKAFLERNIPLIWEGKGLEEKGIEASSGRVLVDVSKEFFRPAEVDSLLGDSTKAFKEMGWKPRTSFEELVSLMVQSDYKEMLSSEEISLH